ncbi:hypothetical protein PP766_gp61 [Escherichia phage U1G]|uniref:Uncharacterized protein n=1 Tax=Escherichia phage U1G TaxID=2853091 RepID=A0AAE7STF8_9CAUD|nr:hypothetical protein PP766_gp61 [Escherichia phage U1G]QXV71894.1 hypothetical protein [Escherichia phage U1G]
MNKFTIHWLNGKVSSFMGGEPAEGKKHSTLIQKAAKS